MPNKRLQRYDRAQIAKLVKESKPGQFQPTINEVVFWYDNLNENLFDSELPTLSSLKFCKSRDYWGEIECKQYKKDGTIRADLKLSYHFKSFKDFVEIIAHEMIHVWEYKTYGAMGHGERFFSWEPRLKRYGLNLSVTQ